MKHKNLLFFMTDQQRFDTLHTSVRGEDVTPTWNKLADEGTWFTHAYNTCPLCVPARTALASGKNPLETGMLLNDLPGKIATDQKTLHSFLSDAGYEVAHIGVNHISIAPRLADKLQYGAWEDDESYESFAKEHDLDIKAKDYQRTAVSELCEGVYKQNLYSNAQVTTFTEDISLFKDVWFTDQALSFLQKEHEKPFALFVCLWAPHPPLVVPQAYHSLFPPEAITLPEHLGTPSEHEPTSRRKGAAAQLGNHPPQEGWKEAWSAHYALTRLCDDQLKRLLICLEEQQIRDDTLIVCTTDHGEQLGEHKMYQKMEMYESAVRVPAIFSMPKAPSSIHDTAISHLDFVPTVLDLLGIGTDQTFEGQSLAGSVQQAIEVTSKDIHGVYCGNHAFGDMRRMLVRDMWKYIWDGEQGELYNLKTDPHERENLAYNNLYKGKTNHMHEALKEWAQSYGDFLAY